MEMLANCERKANRPHVTQIYRGFLATSYILHGRAGIYETYRSKVADALSPPVVVFPPKCNVRTLAAKVRTPKRQTLRPPSSVDVLSMLGVSCHLFVSLKIIKMEMHRAGHAHLRARSLAATFFLGGGELAGLSPVCSELQKKCEAN